MNVGLGYGCVGGKQKHPYLFMSSSEGGPGRGHEKRFLLIVNTTHETEMFTKRKQTNKQASRQASKEQKEEKMTNKQTMKLGNKECQTCENELPERNTIQP